MGRRLLRRSLRAPSLERRLLMPLSASPRRVPVPATMKNSLPARHPWPRFLVLLAAAGAAACKIHGAGGADAAAHEAGTPAAAASGLPAPPDVAAPPGDATTTASGLASKVLT